MPTAEQTLTEIINLAAAHFKVSQERISPDGDFFKTLGIDSLQALDLLTRLEHHFKLSFQTTNCRASPIFAPWQQESKRDSDGPLAIALPVDCERTCA